MQSELGTKHSNLLQLQMEVLNANQCHLLFTEILRKTKPLRVFSFRVALRDIVNDTIQFQLCIWQYFFNLYGNKIIIA